MNSRIIEPFIRFMGGGAKRGVWMCDFQFKHINYANSEVACGINAGINYNNTTFIIEIDDDGIRDGTDEERER